MWNVWDSADWQYFYLPESIFLDGKGNLINRVKINETEHPEFGYTKQTGAITTLDKYENTYGYYEIRLIPNLTSGMWNAFWLMAGDLVLKPGEYSDMIVDYVKVYQSPAD